MKNQQGMTLISLILISVLVISVAVVGIKVVPSFIEYYSVLKVIKAIDASGELKGTSVSEIRKSYDKRAYIDDIKSVAGADLDISKDGNDIVIAFEYSKKISLVNNVSLCIDFTGSTSSNKGGN